MTNAPEIAEIIVILQKNCSLLTKKKDNRRKSKQRFTTFSFSFYFYSLFLHKSFFHFFISLKKQNQILKAISKYVFCLTEQPPKRRKVYVTQHCAALVSQAKKTIFTYICYLQVFILLPHFQVTPIGAYFFVPLFSIFAQVNILHLIFYSCSG